MSELQKNREGFLPVALDLDDLSEECFDIDLYRHRFRKGKSLEPTRPRLPQFTLSSANLTNWTGGLQEAVSRFAAITETRRKQFQRIDSQFQRIDSLEKEVRDLREKISDVAAQPFTIFLTDLPSPLKLLRDVPVLIQPTGDDFVATFVEAGISATGDTESEAALNLKDIIAQKFAILGNMADGKLGIIPRQQLNALRKLIEMEG